MELKKREEIIKALGLCCEYAPLRCDECPMEAPPKTFKGSLSCSDELMSNALSLIKELTEEIKDLEAEYDHVYKQAEADIRGNMADGGTSCHWCADKTKADTVREFASYLKKQSFCCDPGNWISFDAIDADELDNYAKEFLEE